MHHFLCHIGKKHKDKTYDQEFEDQDYVCWVKTHVKVAGTTQEQPQFLHYLLLRECEAGAAAEPVPAEPVEDPAEQEHDFLDHQEAEAVTVEQPA